MKVKEGVSIKIGPPLEISLPPAISRLLRGRGSHPGSNSDSYIKGEKARIEEERRKAEKRAQQSGLESPFRENT